jgi:hypothetical protein
MLPAQSSALPRTEFSLSATQEPPTPSGTPSEKARHRHCTPLIQRRSSQPQLGDVRRGILAFGWSPILEPQSTPVEVLGEVVAPHASKCEHQGATSSSDGQSAKSEGADGQAIETRVSTAEQNPLSGPEKTATRGNEGPVLSKPALKTHDSKRIVEDHIAAAETLSVKPSPGLPLPQIKVSPPVGSACSPISLGTRLIRQNSAKELRQRPRAGLKKPYSSEEALYSRPVFNEEIDAMAFSLDKLRTPKPAPAAPVEIPASDASASRGDRLRLKIKSRTKPAVMKARKLVLRKKILALILGKEVSEIVEPHLNAAASGSGGVQGAPAGALL